MDRRAFLLANSPARGCILLTATARITTMHKCILLAFAGCLGFSAAAAPSAAVSIRQIHFSTEGQATRVVIETAGAVAYRSARLRDPERIYFDFEGSSATPGARVIPVSSKLLKRIRVSERQPGGTRVVLDVEPGVEFAVSRLSEPDRLVIDLRPAGSAPTPPAVAERAPAPAATPAPAPPPAPPPPAPLAPEPVAPQTAAPQEAPAVASVPPGPVVVEEIVAKVNNEIVTRSDIDKYRRIMEADIAHQQLGPVRAQQVLQQEEVNLLRDRIDQLLLVQKGKQLDIKVDQDLSKQIAQLQLKSGITDPDKFQQWVREGTGMSFEDYKQQMKDSLMTSEVVRREVGGRIAISKTEERQYYDEHKNEFVREEQVWLQEILISTAGKDEKGGAAADKKAKDVVSRARKGENFSTLAKENSDAETAESGGNLPAFKHGMLKKEIEDLVFNQTKGYVTDPIRQANGFLILRVAQRDAAGLQPFEAVENEVADRLYAPKMQPAMRTYLTKLRQEAFLQIRAGYVDSGAAPGKDTSWQAMAKLKPQTVTKQEVAERTRRKRLLFVLPIPGTTKRVGLTSSSVATGPR